MKRTHLWRNTDKGYAVLKSPSYIQNAPTSKTGGVNAETHPEAGQQDKKMCAGMKSHETKAQLRGTKLTSAIRMDQHFRESI